MKKLLAVILSVIMVFSFAACAGKSANNEGESQTEEENTRSEAYGEQVAGRGQRPPHHQQPGI